MEEKTKKCVELRFECQLLSEKVHSVSTFTPQEIDDIRKKIHLRLEDVLSFLKRTS